MNERVNELIRSFEELKLDYVFIFNPTNIYYLTGFNSNPFERFLMLAIDMHNHKVNLFLPELDKEEALNIFDKNELTPISDGEDPLMSVKKLVGDSKLNIGIEKNYLTVGNFEHINKNLDADYFNIDDYLNNMMLIKSKKEIENVKKAISISKKGFDLLTENKLIGLTEKEISHMIQNKLLEEGAHYAPSPLVLSGKASAYPHGKTSDKKIEYGDFLLIDFTVNVNGYYSDITRTFIIGEASNQQKEIYETVLNANTKAIKGIAIDSKLQEIDLIARNVIENKGYGNYFNHRVGHGLGLSIHEEPSIDKNNKNKMLCGMLFTIEPGIYIPSIGGVRIEDNVYFSENGKVEVLTSSISKELTILNG